MTRADRPLRSGSKRSAEPADSTTASASTKHGPNRLLLAVLVVLIAILCVLIALLLRRGDAPIPSGTDVGPSPRPLLAIIGPGKGDRPAFTRPLAAAWSPDGDIYVSDTGNARVCVFNSRGRFLREFGRPNAKSRTSSYALQQPAGIAVGPDGHVYVADIRAGAVVVFDDRGRFVKTLRPRESVKSASGHWTPTDVAVTEGQIFVTDEAGVAIFAVDGSLTARIDQADGSSLSHPNGVAARPNGSLVISDTNHGRVVSVDQSGTLLWALGPDEAGRRVVGLPRGLSVAQNGSILVADAFLFGIQHLSDGGAVIEGYGGRGPGMGRFEFPNDVDVRADLVLVADKDNNRVQVLRWPGLAAPAQQ